MQTSVGTPLGGQGTLIMSLGPYPQGSFVRSARLMIFDYQSDSDMNFAVALAAFGGLSPVANADFLAGKSLLRGFPSASGPQSLGNYVTLTQTISKAESGVGGVTVRFVVPPLVVDFPINAELEPGHIIACGVQQLNPPGDGGTLGWYGLFSLDIESRGGTPFLI